MGKFSREHIDDTPKPLHKMVHYKMVHYKMVHYKKVHYKMVHYKMVHYKKVHYKMVHYNMVYYKKVHYKMVYYKMVSDVRWFKVKPKTVLYKQKCIEYRGIVKEEYLVIIMG